MVWSSFQKRSVKQCLEAVWKFSLVIVIFMISPYNEHIHMCAVHVTGR